MLYLVAAAAAAAVVMAAAVPEVGTAVETAHQLSFALMLGPGKNSDLSARRRLHCPTRHIQQGSATCGTSVRGFAWC